MAYHLSQEARAGLSEFRIPRDFGDKLFEFQTAAVKIAAHHLNKRGGVLIGDVVGLGKTLMATALARIFEDDHGLETLIICPKNLVPMWEDYRDRYRLAREGPVASADVQHELPEPPALSARADRREPQPRNREGKRYRAIQEYIQENDSKCILLSATPYNKTYLDLSNQLRLFVPEDDDLGIRPERLLRELGETEFIRRHQCPVRSLAAFEKSDYADDWRELMRLYLVRRTRSFIQDNYAETDPDNGRKYLTFDDGTRSYFPTRVPKTVKFTIDDNEPERPVRPALSPTTWSTPINHLTLPRYGLGNYHRRRRPHEPPTQTEAQAARRPLPRRQAAMGFCRTNLFKRLESSGTPSSSRSSATSCATSSILHAIENGLPLPIGTQDAELARRRVNDEDDELSDASAELMTTTATPTRQTGPTGLRTEADFSDARRRGLRALRGPVQAALQVAAAGPVRHDARDGPADDAKRLLGVLRRCGAWDPARDAKLDALVELLTKTAPEREGARLHPVRRHGRLPRRRSFSARGVTRLAASPATPTTRPTLAWRFSPESNDKRDQVTPDDELRVAGRHRRAERRPEPAGLLPSSSTTTCPGRSSG